MMCPSPAIRMLSGLVLMRFGVTSPSHTKPKPPPAMPRQGVPRLALPRLPLPIACPGPRGTSLRYNEPLSRSVPRPVRSGKAGRAFIRNGKSPGQTGTRPGAKAAPGRVSAHRRLHPGDPPHNHPAGAWHQRLAAADRCSHFLGYASHIDWQNRVAHLLSDHSKNRHGASGAPGASARHARHRHPASASDPRPVQARKRPAGGRRRKMSGCA
jgi:hypothetical protein